MLRYPGTPGLVPHRVPDVVEVAFAFLARVRRARAFHPRGALFVAALRVTEPGPGLGAALAAAAGAPDRAVLVRLSKSIGTPAAAPDLLGVALRLDTADGPLDLLFSTTGRRRATRLLLAPATGWCHRPYSTVLPYRLHDGLTTPALEPVVRERRIGASLDAAREAVRAAPLVFAVTEPAPAGGRRAVATLELTSVVPGDDDPVAFDPVRNAHPALRPARVLTGLRRRSYIGSRRGRGADPAALRRRAATVLE